MLSVIFQRKHIKQPKELFKPIEICLERKDLGNQQSEDQSLLVIEKEQSLSILSDYIGQPKREKKQIKKLENNGGHGLISLMQKSKPLLMICITVYNEPREQLEKTLQGILNNLPKFSEVGISNQQIAVVVVFDGIDRINVDKDTNKNMIGLFKEYDLLCEISNEDSLQNQYNLYKKNLEKSKKDIIAIKKSLETETNDEKKSQKINLTFEEEQLYNKIKKTQKNQANQIHDWELKILALQQVKDDAENYIKERETTAWLYQVRRLVQSDEQQLDNSFDLGDQQRILQNIIQEDHEKNLLNIFFCLKFKNGGKLNSHLWFFRGFCYEFQPQYCVILDCGLEPDENAIFKFFAAMETDKNIGGVCGFMGLKCERIVDDSGYHDKSYDNEVRQIDSFSHSLTDFFDIQKAQVFEYDFAHMIDKPFESLFGFIHVLPGAFSGYRWEALKKDASGNSILDSYLKTQLDPNYKYKDLEEANMYLAEDRILCLKIFAKENCKYKLMYIPDAFAVVDPVTSITNLMGQRRRWINGSWFALNYVLENQNLVLKSKHGNIQKLLFYFSMLYAKLNQLLTYMVISTFFIVLFMTTHAIFENYKINGLYGQSIEGSSIAQIIIFIYCMLIYTLIFYSLNFNQVHPAALPKFYFITSLLGIYAVTTFSIVIYGCYLIFSEDQKSAIDPDSNKITPTALKLLILISIFSHGIPVILNWKKCIEVLLSLHHYIFYSPYYVHVLIIFAFCRIDDLSWGTKGLEDTNKGAGQGAGQIASDPKYYEWKSNHIDQVKKDKKFYFVMKWVFSNVIFSYIIVAIMTENEKKYIVQKVLAYFVSFIIIFRCLGSSLYYIWYMFFFKLKMIKTMENNKPMYSQMQQNINKEIIENISKYYTFSRFQNNQEQ